jgi:hypothetical protein
VSCNRAAFRCTGPEAVSSDFATSKDLWSSRPYALATATFQSNYQSQSLSTVSKNIRSWKDVKCASNTALAAKSSSRSAIRTIFILERRRA